MLFLCYPRCSTCRKAQKWLDGREVKYVFRDIQKQNPTAKELKGWYARSGMELKRFWNTSGKKYRDMSLKNLLPDMSSEEQINLLSTNGLLVKRPLLVGEDFVLVGFKESDWEKVLASE